MQHHHHDDGCKLLLQQQQQQQQQQQARAARTRHTSLFHLSFLSFGAYSLAYMMMDRLCLSRAA
jgi:hypothetical protein